MPFTEESIDLARALVPPQGNACGHRRVFVTPLPDALLDATDGPDTWSPRVILQHLTWAEVDDWIPRVRLILEQQGSRPVHAVRSRRRPPGMTAGPSPRLGDEFLRLARGEPRRPWTAFRLGPAELQLPGSHPALGGVTMSQLIASWVAHAWRTSIRSRARLRAADAASGSRGVSSCGR